MPIWASALGYFIAYVPYAYLTKSVAHSGIDGLSLLPVTTMVSAVGMLTFLGVTGLWRRAPQRKIGPFSVPFPRRATLASGACTAAIVVTTTLAYTFAGESIVLMMLLMRGAVLAVAPIVDHLSGRVVRWYSWTALGLSFGAILLSVGGARFELSAEAVIDVALYATAYFLRLRFMVKHAKRDRASNERFFVEEQLVATPLAFLTLLVLALVAPAEVASPLRAGFIELPFDASLGLLVVIGLMSQLTGIFGALVLLDSRESSFSVPVNRASSIVAGIVATSALWLFEGEAAPASHELMGAVLVLAAMMVLAIGSRGHRLIDGR